MRGGLGALERLLRRHRAEGHQVVAIRQPDVGGRVLLVNGDSLFEIGDSLFQIRLAALIPIEPPGQICLPGQGVGRRGAVFGWRSGAGEPHRNCAGNGRGKLIFAG